MTTTMEHSVSAGVLHSKSSNCCTSPDCSSSTGGEQCHHSPSSERRPSLINTSDLGRPKEFSGKEEDFQQLSKETKAFFVGVIKESKTMLEWVADQTTGISTDFIVREFLPIMTNQERGIQSMESVLQQMHTKCFRISRVTKRTTLLPIRGRTHWRRGDDCSRSTRRCWRTR